MSNITPWQIPPTAYNSGHARGGAGACKSTVNDLFIFYKAWTEVANDQKRTRKANTSGSAFRRVHDTWGPHASINEESDYGQGWVVT
ncbi:putative beta-lactamase transpeptidase-like protein [Seiridium cardinale]